MLITYILNFHSQHAKCQFHLSFDCAWSVKGIRFFFLARDVLSIEIHENKHNKISSEKLLYRINGCFKSVTISTALIVQGRECNIFLRKKIGPWLNY